MSNAKRDNNRITTLLAVSNVDGETPVLLWADPTTHRLLVTGLGGTSHNFLSATHPDTVAASPVLGDTVYGDATPKWTKLAGNTTTTKKFLNQTGDGAISAIPSWDALGAGDLPDLSGVYAVIDQTFYIGTTQVAINRASAALTLAGLTLTTPDIGTPSAGVLTNATGLPIAGLANGTDGELITWDASGNAAAVAVGTANQILTSNGAGAAPTFKTATEGGDVSKVGTPADNQVGVWTGDGTIEGTAGFTYDGSNLQLTGDIGSTGTRITKGWFTDLQATNPIAGSVTGNAATVTGLTLASGSLTLAGADAITLTTTAATSVTLPTTGTLAVVGTDLPLAGGTMTGDIQLGETDIKLDAVLSGDEKWSGITMAGTAGATLAVGDICFLQTADSKWELVDGILDGTDVGFKLQLGICVLAGNADAATEMLTYGKVRSAAFPAFTVGAPVYLDDTAGNIVVAQPTTTNFAIRVVGYAITAEDLMFNPSNDYVVHV